MLAEGTGQLCRESGPLEMDGQSSAQRECTPLGATILMSGMAHSQRNGCRMRLLSCRDLGCSRRLRTSCINASLNYKADRPQQHLLIGSAAESLVLETSASTLPGSMTFLVASVALLSLVLASASPNSPDSSQLIPRSSNSMTTAVVGAGGATGLECVKRLLSEGHRVKAVRGFGGICFHNFDIIDDA